MTSQMITLRMDSKFLSEIDATAKIGNYHSRVEFIRSALREKIKSENTKEVLEALKGLKGISKTKTTDEQMENIKEEVGKELQSETKEERKKRLDEFFKIWHPQV